MNSADIIVIGAGPGGYTTAAGAASAGMKTVLFERGHLGGTCLNRGCIPTKALCRSAEIADAVAEAAAFGLRIDGTVTPDYATASRRKDEVVATLREGVAEELRGVEVISAEARFTGPHTIEAGGEEWTAPKIIIATGSRPASLPIPGAELAIDSDRALGLEQLPESMIIIGGGVIGMEFASIFSSFGVRVTVIEYYPEILPPFDAEIAKRLRMSLKRKGIEIITGAAVKAITPGLTVEYEAKGKQRTATAEMVMMAVGRKAVLPDGLDKAGIATERGFITVDDRMMTSCDGVYAIGDVNGRCMLAHAADAQGRVALGQAELSDVIPSAVFTRPECAMVGLTESRCADSGLGFKVGKSTFRANGKAVAMGEPDGMVKVIVSTDSGRLLGCHICGAHAADIVQEAALAMSAGLPASAIADTIHGHPTLSETLLAAVRSALKA